MHWYICDFLLARLSECGPAERIAGSIYHMVLTIFLNNVLALNQDNHDRKLLTLMHIMETTIWENIRENPTRTWI
jgi:hypothetical protein